MLNIPFHTVLLKQRSSIAQSSPQSLLYVGLPKLLLSSASAGFLTALCYRGNPAGMEETG